MFVKHSNNFKVSDCTLTDLSFLVIFFFPMKILEVNHQLLQTAIFKTLGLFFMEIKTYLDKKVLYSFLSKVYVPHLEKNFSQTI